jgi:hypothetical protein
VRVFFPVTILFTCARFSLTLHRKTMMPLEKPTKIFQSRRGYPYPQKNLQPNFDQKISSLDIFEF